MVAGYDSGAFERNKRDISSQYDRDSITNAYGRFLSQQRGERSLGDMSRSFGRQYAPQKASFGQRGFTPGITAGPQQESMRRFIGDYGREYGRTQQGITQELQQFDQNQAYLDSWKQQALADLQAEKAQAIANTATGIQSARNYYGGL